MYDTKIQTPISSKILSKAKLRAEKAGFSSINDVIRIVVKQFAEGNINFNVSMGPTRKNIPEVSDYEQKQLIDILKRIQDGGDDIIVASETITL